MCSALFFQLIRGFKHMARRPKPARWRVQSGLLDHFIVVMFCQIIKTSHHHHKMGEIKTAPFPDFGRYHMHDTINRTPKSCPRANVFADYSPTVGEKAAQFV